MSPISHQCRPCLVYLNIPQFCLCLLNQIHDIYKSSRASGKGCGSELTPSGVTEGFPPPCLSLSVSTARMTGSLLALQLNSSPCQSCIRMPWSASPEDWEDSCGESRDSVGAPSVAAQSLWGGDMLQTLSLPRIHLPWQATQLLFSEGSSSRSRWSQLHPESRTY